MSNDPQKFINPISILKNFGLQSKRGTDCLQKRDGPSGGTRRTVRGCSTDCSRGRRGRMSYWMFWSKFRTVCAEVLDRPCASWTVHRCVTVCPHEPCVGGAGHEQISQQTHAPSSLTHKGLFLHLSLFLLVKKEPPLGILFGALPGPSEHIHGLSTRFSTMSSEHFFDYLILSHGF
jgi:hypothetical protein